MLKLNSCWELEGAYLKVKSYNEETQLYHCLRVGPLTRFPSYVDLEEAILAEATPINEMEFLKIFTGSRSPRMEHKYKGNGFWRKQEIKDVPAVRRNIGVEDIEKNKDQPADEEIDI